MNRVSQLEYAKTILSKVAFDRNLFLKEYRKALRTLEPAEKDHLRSWSKIYLPLEDGQLALGLGNSRNPTIWVVKNSTETEPAGISMVPLGRDMDLHQQKPGEYAMYTSWETAIEGARKLKERHKLSEMRIVYPNGTVKVLN